MAVSRSLARATCLLSCSLSSAVIWNKNVTNTAALQVTGREHAAKASHPPLVMVAHGCSGTTGVFYILRKLFKHLGLNDVAHTGGGELLRDLDKSNTREEFKNVLWGALEWKTWKDLDAANGLKEKIKIMNKRTNQDQQSLLTKLQLDLAEANPDAMQYLFHELNARPFILRRRNSLDSLACSITDFCDHDRVKNYGHNVDQDGKEVPCEFRGRMGDEDKASREKEHASIWVDTSTLKQNLQALEDENKHQEDYLRHDQGFADVKTFDAEDLFAFEYDRESLHSSSFHWHELLGALGYTASVDEVQSALKDFDSFPPPKKHYETFYNYNKLVGLLQDSQWADQLRT